MTNPNSYRNKIPIFYRKQTIDIMLFAHVTAMCKYGYTIKESIEDFKQTYNLNEDEYPLESALVTFSNMRNAFLWNELRDGKI